MKSLHLFCAGLNLSLVAFGAWGYSVTGYGFFVAMIVFGLVCGSSATAALRKAKGVAV